MDEGASRKKWEGESDHTGGGGDKREVKEGVRGEGGKEEEGRGKERG